MLKKMVILGVIGFVAVSALSGTKLYSYVCSLARDARERAESKIPPEEEIKRLRNEIRKLDGDIVKVAEAWAVQDVEVEKLQPKVEASIRTQKAALAELKTRGERIKSSEGHVTFGTKTSTVEDAKAELERDASKYKSAQATLDLQQSTLANRIKARDGLKQQLDTMKAQKSELATAVDELEVQLIAHKAEQARSKYQTDDSRLAKIKEDIQNLKTKMSVETKKHKALQDLNGETPVAAPKAEPTKSVDDILGGLEPATKPAGEKTETKVPVVD